MSRFPWRVDASTRTRERKRVNAAETSLIAANERIDSLWRRRIKRRNKGYTAKTKDNDGNGRIKSDKQLWRGGAEAAQGGVVM